MLCPICHTEFFPPYKQTKYCSPLCAKTAKQLHRKEKNSPIHKVCGSCGKPFVAQNGHFKYCSPECVRVAKRIQNNNFYQNHTQQRKTYRYYRYRLKRDQILAKQKLKRREKAAAEGKTFRPRKVKLSPEYDWRIHRPNLLKNLQSLPTKVISIPAAIAQNREPTLDEILAFIFKED